MSYYLGYSSDELWHESKFPLNNYWWHGAEKKENSIGFLSEEFDSCADMVALGCSYTYGVGVEESKTWAQIIADNKNLKYHNISGSGRSVQWAINNFFSYVHKFGNPKTVVALFPEFTRIQIASKPTEMITKYLPKGIEIKSGVLRYGSFTSKRTGDKYFKAPLIAEETFPPETAFDLSLQFIKMLELYCNSNGIKLLWSTWDKHQENWLESNIAKTEFKNFISIKTWEWHVREQDNFYERYCQEKHSSIEVCNYYEKCHEEYEILYGDNFYRASDRREGNPEAHWGVHVHAHVADTFIKHLNEMDNCERQ
jgi:hypothetical protein